MGKFIKRASKKAGLPPGTLVHIGEKKTAPVRISLWDYGPEHVQEKELQDIADAFPFDQTPSATWINIDGIHNTALIERLGAHFHIHSLVLEDIVNAGQRTKIEDYEDYLFLVVKMLLYDTSLAEVKSEQVSMLLTPACLITFQEMPGDVFDTVRDRIRRGRGRIRKSGCDYLAYALLDAVVDQYFGVLEIFGDRIEAIEEDLDEDAAPDLLQQIHRIKRDMIYMRKQVWPLRETVSSLMKNESALIHEHTGVFLADVYDHTIQVIDTVESFRDILGGMMDLYLSSVSNRMNEVMKVLTIMATIFIPLTFVAGIYGMNFKYMPELEWHWGYAGAWGVMLTTALGMIVYFKIKKWL